MDCKMTFEKGISETVETKSGDEICAVVCTEGEKERWRIKVVFDGEVPEKLKFIDYKKRIQIADTIQKIINK